MRKITGLCVAGTLAAAGAHADLLPVQSYDMLNGETGSFTYWDDTYNGSGDPTVSLSPLSGGTGQLTDGFVATENWFVTPEPYVAWDTVVPEITFHFGSSVLVDSITLYIDDSNGNGGVTPPSSIELSIGGEIFNGLISDPDSGAPFSVTFDKLDMSGDAAVLRLFDGAAQWVFVSEVVFEGVVPAPAALSVLAATALCARRRR